MTAVFTAKPNLAPYLAAPAQVALDTKNPPRASDALLDWSKPDQIEDAEFNERLWKAIKNTPPPRPAALPSCGLERTIARVAQDWHGSPAIRRNDTYLGGLRMAR